MRRLALVWPGVLAASLACPPPSYGVLRTGHIATAPNLACVRELLAQDPEISRLREEDYGGARRLTWRGLAPPNSVPTFIYTYGPHEYWLQFTIDQDRPVDVYHGAHTAKTAPASELLGIRSHLVALEDRLANRCSVPGLLANLRETCRGENCDELEELARSD